MHVRGLWRGHPMGTVLRWEVPNTLEHREQKNSQVLPGRRPISLVYTISIRCSQYGQMGCTSSGGAELCTLRIGCDRPKIPIAETVGPPAMVVPGSKVPTGRARALIGSVGCVQEVEQPIADHVGLVRDDGMIASRQQFGSTVR